MDDQHAAQYLSPAEIQQILDSPRERGAVDADGNPLKKAVPKTTANEEMAAGSSANPGHTVTSRQGVPTDDAAYYSGIRWVVHLPAVGILKKSIHQRFFR